MDSGSRPGADAGAEHRGVERTEAAPRRSGGAVAAFLAVLAAACCRPLLEPGWFSSHEQLRPIARALAAAHEIAAGDLYPRWLSTAYLGKGAPVLEFYPPAYSLLVAYGNALGLPLVVAAKLVLYAGFLAGALGAWSWARRHLGDGPAVVAAILYLFAPYHLVDVYVRGATAEFTALAALPFLLLAIDLSVEHASPRGVAALAISTATVVLAHPLGALMIAPFAAAYAIARSVRRPGRGGALGRIGAGVALGVALSAFYWLPAAAESAALSRERIESQLTSYYSPFHHFVYPAQWLDPRWGFGNSVVGPDDEMSFQLGLLQVAALAASALALPFLARPRRRFVLLVLALGAGAVALTSEVTGAVYAALPPLRSVQFPWRFLGPATLFLSAAGAAWASALVDRGRARAVLPAAVVAALALLLSVPQRTVRSVLPLPDDQASLQAAVDHDPFSASFGNGDEYLPKDANVQAATTIRGGPSPRAEGAEVEVVRADRTDLSFEVRFERGGTVVVPWHFFPGWRASLDGRDWPLAPDRDGLLSLAVPAGRHAVRVRVGTTAPRVIGWCLAAAALALLGALAVRARTRRAAAAARDATPHAVRSATVRARWRALRGRLGSAWEAVHAGRDRWTVATVALLLAGAVVVLATFRQYGITIDEGVQSDVGRNVVAWFASAGEDGRALQGGASGDLHLYGGIFEAAAEVAASAVPLDRFDLRHLLNALVGLAGVAGVALLARRLGDARAGFFAAALLVTTPFWWGHSFANSKDIPFAAAYAWFLVALLRACDGLPRTGWRSLAAAGGALGVALALRPGALALLLPMAAGIVALRLLPSLRASGPGRWRDASAAAWRLAALTAMGWAGMLAIWPYGLCNPLRGPLQAVAAARRFRWWGLVHFEGGWVWSTDLPWSYAPRWFLATLPETWFIVALAGVAAAAFAWRRDRVRPSLRAEWLDRAVVAAAGFGPIAAAVVLRPVLYDGIRHLLFAVPALAALAGWGLSAALGRLPRRAGLAALGAAAALACVAVVDAVRLHPYQYVYFNRAVAGGLAGASRDLELDYWEAAGREAMEWVVRNVVPEGDRPLTVASTIDPIVASHVVDRDAAARARFVVTQIDAPDLRITSTRWFRHRATGRVLHVVQRMGVPLLYVIQTLAEGDPLVLEGGDAAVAIPAADGWSGMPRYKEGDLSGAFSLLRSRGAPATGEAWVLPSRRFASDEELRAWAVDQARNRLGLPPDALEPERVEGPAARGWLVGGPSGRGWAGAVAARVGTEAVLVAYARYHEAGDDADELRSWIREARPATQAERRRP